MKAIIIGTPGKGKTTLAKILKQDYPNTVIVSLCKLRGALNIHEPYKEYETEVAPQNVKILYQLLDIMLNIYENIIIEGYGLNPENAKNLGNKHHCPVILLCHKDTNIEQDIELVRKYDDKNKWTNFRTNEYLHSLYSFYKQVELKWIESMPASNIYDTSDNFQATLQDAYNYIIKTNS